MGKSSENMRILLISTILLFGFYGLAIAQDNVQQLTTYLEEARSRSTNPLPQTVLASVAGQENDFFNAIQPYLTDSMGDVKYRAYSVLHQVGQSSPSEPFRKRVVMALLEGVKDRSVSTTCSRFLPQYTKDDFTPIALDSVIALVRREAGAYIPMIKLAGYLDLTQVQRNLINNLLEQGKLNSGERWATYLVLARMSEPNAIDYLVRRVSAVPVNDDIIYEVYGDLAYTRQKQVVQLIVETVMSDDTQCGSANLDSDETILCAYRAMEFLPGVVADFPWERDVTGDLAVDDYETALAEIRIWFATNPDYRMDRGGFE